MCYDYSGLNSLVTCNLQFFCGTCIVSTLVRMTRFNVCGGLVPLKEKLTT